MDDKINETESMLTLLENKWAPVLDMEGQDPITNSYRRKTTAMMLENQAESLGMDVNSPETLTEASTASTTLSGNAENWNPILMSLVRRAAPKMIAYDVCGVQPMSGPSGLIFALRATYGANGGSVGAAAAQEALGLDEARTSFGGTGGFGTSGVGGSDFGSTAGTGIAGISIGRAMDTVMGEILGSDTGGDMNEMSFNIDSTSVVARTRALRASYTMETQQDMKAIHGLDAKQELANILSQEVLAEINREVIRTIYTTAKTGSQSNTTTVGVFDLDTDSNGRWSVERFKGLLFHLKRECNTIARETRRGAGNFVICSSDVAAAMEMVGVLDTTNAVNANLEVDDSGNTFAGTLTGGKIKVYIDPYHNSSTNDYMCVGYKGSSPYDAGLFYCPYVPLQMMQATAEDTFQPRIGFKTRYGLVANPFVMQNSTTPDEQALTAGKNQFYRFSVISNIA